MRVENILQISQIGDSPLWGETERFAGVHGKTFTLQFNHSNQKSIAVSDESPRLNQNNKWNTFFIPGKQQTSPQHLARVGPWLRVNHCICADTSHSKSHQQKRKILKKGKIPNSKGSSTERRITRKPSVSLVKSLSNIPNILLLAYDLSWGEEGGRRRWDDAGRVLQ